MRDTLGKLSVATLYGRSFDVAHYMVSRALTLIRAGTPGTSIFLESFLSEPIVASLRTDRIVATTVDSYVSARP